MNSRRNPRLNLCVPIQMETKESSVQMHSSMDVTSQLVLDIASIKLRFKQDILKCVLDFVRTLFLHSEWIVFHDPIIALSIWHKNICEYKQGKVEIKMKARASPGLLIR